jgi:hypothetical protein
VKAQAQIQDDQSQIQQYQAQLQTYENSVKRDKERTENNSTLVNALETPGVKLLTFKPVEGVSSAAYASVTAYAFVIENSKVLFVASKMPAPPEQRQFQLWLVRKSDHHFVSLGVFTPRPDSPAVVTYEEKGIIGDLGGLLVTEEQSTGGTDPSDNKVLETPAASAPAVPPTPEALFF